jgi:1,4-dihydroxy-2-naphthoate polyprenyltransferase
MLGPVGPPLATRLVAFVKLGRPQFLVGGFVLYGLGAALAAAGGAAVDWRRYVWGQLVITATQLMTHYANDYFDLEADRANATPTRWSGGSRILPAGVLPPIVALGAALVLGTGALAAALSLGAQARDAPLVVPLALLMLALSWSYSAPPLRLHARGVGELTTAVVVTLLTPLLGFYLQAAALRKELFLAALPVSGLQFAMLLAIEFPDAAGDAVGGKRTLVVRRGTEWAARLYAAVVLGSFVALPALAAAGLPGRVAAAAALVAPVGVVQAVRASRGGFRDPARWESLAFWSVAQLIATAVAELAGALASIARPG